MASSVHSSAAASAAAAAAAVNPASVMTAGKPKAYRDKESGGYRYYEAPSCTTSFHKKCKIYDLEQIRNYWSERIIKIISEGAFTDNEAAMKCAALCLSYMMSLPLMQIRQLNHGTPHWMMPPRAPTVPSTITFSYSSNLITGDFSKTGREVSAIFPMYPLPLKIAVIACEESMVHSDVTIQLSEWVVNCAPLVGARWMDNSATNSKQITAQPETPLALVNSVDTRSATSRASLTASKLWVSIFGLDIPSGASLKPHYEALNKFRTSCGVLPHPRVFAMHGIFPEALFLTDRTVVFADRCFAGARNPNSNAIEVNQRAVAAYQQQCPSPTSRSPETAVLEVADLADQPNFSQEWVDEAEFAFGIDPTAYQSTVYHFIEANMPPAGLIDTIARIYHSYLI